MMRNAIICWAAWLLAHGFVFAGDIHDATGSGDLAKVRSLLQSQPDLVNSREEDGSTPLHIAARLGQLEIVRVLLEAKASISTTNRSGLTALQMARVRNHQKIVELLLASNPDKQDKFSVLKANVWEGIIKNDTARVKSLIENNPDFDLVNCKDPQNNMPIHLGVYSGNLELVTFLLDKKAAPDARNKEGNTPLHAAAYTGRREIAELLLKKSVPVDIASEDGITPLHLACDRGHFEVVKFLVENKADVNAHSKVGITPLLLASDKGHIEIAKYLLDLKADPNAQGDKNATPLHFAVRNADAPFVQLLLGYKPDLTLKTIDGYTPLGLANFRALINIADILKKAGAPEK